ncbi:MAG TPA: hypothetical protein VLI90_08270 [Tepidisphaeraceae bacterium]|nr:hypothetical protein [Tepidisphaeraceae bacterium]
MQGSDKPIVPLPADAYVFIDGTPRFQQQNFTNLEGTFIVDVPLQTTDRYLTLVTCTHADPKIANSIWFNWIVFSDPQFQLSANAPR